MEMNLFIAYIGITSYGWFVWYRQRLWCNNCR